MKREKITACLMGAALGAAAGMGAAGCFATAFDLPVLFLDLLPVCIGVALISAVLFSLRYGGIVFALLTALGGGYCLRRGMAAEQFRGLLHKILEIYDGAYGWNLVPAAQNAAVGALWPVGMYAALAAAAVAPCVVRRKSLWVCLPVVLLPLASVIVVTDTVPAEGYVLTLLAALIVLALTQAVRRENEAQGNRLTAAVAVPVTAALILLFALIPQEDYVNQSGPYRDEILEKIQSIPQTLEREASDLAFDLLKAPPRQIDLSSLGDRNPSDRVQLEVTSDHSGTLYLRGRDFDRYDGSQWISTESRTEEFGLESKEFWNVTVTTRTEKEILYLPYYPRIPQILVGGSAGNYNGALSVTLTCTALPEDWRITAYASDLPVPPADGMEPFLQLPQATRQGAEEWLAGLFAADAGNTEKADAIAALVTASADYDLHPEPVPEGVPDFALWFLQEAESGYCTHFATAATVLLRAAGVPARYVTGYMVDTAAGRTVTASEEEAHAWAEYFEPRLGCWIVLESTPASGIPTQTAPTAPKQTEPEIQTEPATLPTTPEQPPTAPSGQIQPPTLQVPSVPEDTSPMAPEPKFSPLPLVGLIVLGLGIIGQRKLRLALRRNRQQRGTANQRALMLWQESSRLSRLAGEPQPEELLALAEKAKYSRHTLTDAELQCFATHNRRCIALLKQRNWCRRLMDQYFRAAY